MLEDGLVVHVYNRALHNVHVYIPDRRSVLRIAAAVKDAIDVLMQMNGQRIGSMAGKFWMNSVGTKEKSHFLPSHRGLAS
ncbi:hypothetical protein D3C81_2061630 [compost metagenome]|jgi:hypothetical protein